MIQKIHKYPHPVDLDTAKTFGQYGANLYKDGLFVEGRIYEMYSGHMMMNEIRELKQFEGYDRVDW
jgi:hypothetical protein|tara:strand:+ start:1040 stop:1237 length:198 start_codon:yes stop_codon:yes gene_type:complete